MKDKKRLPKWVIPVAAVAVVAITVLVLFLTGVFEPKTVEVPDIVNMNVDEAQALLQQYELSVCITQKEINDTVDENTVLAQSPAVGTKIHKGGTVNVTISEKSVEIDIPDVVNYKKELAVTVLQNAGFKVEVKEEQTDKFADGSVISQSLTGKGKTGSVITLVVARNGKAEDKKMIKVPSVTGKNLKEASKILDGKLYIIVAEEQYSDSVKKGYIISQSPVADLQVNTYSVISVIISKGKASDVKIVIPSVTLSAKSQAKTALENLGLKVAIKEEYSDSVASGVVISQSIEKGEIVRPGTTVTLTISKGKMPEDYSSQKYPDYTQHVTSDKNETTKKNSSADTTKPATKPATTKPVEDPAEKKYVSEFKITTDKENASAGDIITVSVKLKTNYNIVSVSLPVIYDARVFEIVGGEETNLSSFLEFKGSLVENAYSTNGNWKSPETMYSKTSNPDKWLGKTMMANYKIAFATWVAMPSQGTVLTTLGKEETIVTFKLKVKENAKDTSGRIFLSGDFIKTAEDPQGILSVGRAKADKITVDTIVATGQTIKLDKATTMVVIK